MQPLDDNLFSRLETLFDHPLRVDLGSDRDVAEAHHLVRTDDSHAVEALRLLDRTLRESDVAIAGVSTIDDNHVGSVFYMDLNLGFSPAQLEGLRVFGTVTNLLDRAPPQLPGSIGRTGVLDAFTSLHDVVGRRYTVGVEYKF